MELPPLPTATNTATSGATALNSGYSFTVPADTTTRTLTVYAGGINTTSSLTAHLSDGSSADVVLTAGTAGLYTNQYTITYHAASAGQTLQITLLKTGNLAGQTGGSADLIAAALSGPNSAPAPSPTGTFIDAGGPAAGSYSADADFSGGNTFSTNNSINTSADTTGAPASIYQSERYGNFTYTVPNLVAGNSYSVLLHFAEVYWNAAGQRLFNVSINGQQVLSSFDIVATALGANKANVQSFNTTADASGKITIVFTTVKDNAKVSAIDVVAAAPATPAAPVVTTNPQNQSVTAGQNATFTAAASGTPTPTVQWQVSTDGGSTFSNITNNASATTTTLTLSAAAQTLNGNEYRAVFTNANTATTSSATLTVNPAPSGTFIDAGGPAAGSYSADADFSGGNTFSTTNSINTSADTTGAPASVYQSERYGNFTYTVPGLVAGSTHTVNLHFAEIYWTSAGQRVFHVSINGQQVLTSFDIVATVGSANKAIVKSFTAVADSSGNIQIVFTSVQDNAKVSAIDVV